MMEMLCFALSDREADSYIWLLSPFKVADEMEKKLLILLNCNTFTFKQPLMASGYPIGQHKSKGG